MPEIQGEARFGAQSDLIFSYLGGAGGLHYNEQVAYSRRGNLDVFSGVIAEGPRDWVVRPVTEVFVEREFGEDTTYSALVGAIWPLSAALAFDAGVRGALIDDAWVEECVSG